MANHSATSLTSRYSVAEQMCPACWSASKAGVSACASSATALRSPLTKAQSDLRETKNSISAATPNEALPPVRIPYGDMLHPDESSGPADFSDSPQILSGLGRHAVASYFEQERTKSSMLIGLMSGIVERQLCCLTLVGGDLLRLRSWGAPSMPGNGQTGSAPAPTDRPVSLDHPAPANRKPICEGF